MPDAWLGEHAIHVVKDGCIPRCERLSVSRVGTPLKHFPSSAVLRSMGFVVVKTKHWKCTPEIIEQTGEITDVAPHAEWDRLDAMWPVKLVNAVSVDG